MDQVDGPEILPDEFNLGKSVESQPPVGQHGKYTRKGVKANPAHIPVSLGGQESRYQYIL